MITHREQSGLKNFSRSGLISRSSLFLRWLRTWQMRLTSSLTRRVPPTPVTNIFWSCMYKVDSMDKRTNQCLNLIIDNLVRYLAQWHFKTHTFILRCYMKINLDFSIHDLLSDHFQSSGPLHPWDADMSSCTLEWQIDQEMMLLGFGQVDSMG